MKKSLRKRQRGSHGDGKIYENHGDRRRRLCRKPSDSYYGEKYDVWGVTHKDLDLTDEAAVFKTVEKYRPDVLLHCAAVSDVAECSKKPELSHAVNVLGTEYLAKACGKTGTKLVMCSSDQVYFRKRGEQESLDAYLEPTGRIASKRRKHFTGNKRLTG